MIEVRLTDSEVVVVSLVAGLRQCGARHYQPRYAAGRVGEEEQAVRHLLGAAGEMAYAKAVNCYWPATVNTFRTGADVGRDIQIRTRREHHFDLIVRSEDRGDQRFVLVTGVIPIFRVHGWILGRDAKRTEWIKDYGGHGQFYAPPRSELTPIEGAP